MLLGVDVGGTFTDAVLLDGDRLHSAKAPSTPADQSAGVLTAVAAVLHRAGRAHEEVTRFAHGMTVATNALLEGRGARTVLIATEGFEDVIELARQSRPELYRLCVGRPTPLTPPELRFGAPERMGPQGPLRAMSDAAASELAAQVAAARPEAVAVVLLHAYRHPEHEQMLGRALAQALPGVHVSLSHLVVGTFREYERAATTELDAALSPLLGSYLLRLSAACRERRLPEPEIMHSAGGLIGAEEAGASAIRTVLSGPAAGAAGAAYVARRAGIERALCLDMGGTSCDVCVVQDGHVDERAASEIAGRPIALPSLAIHTVGAGGGSIAWADGGGALRVGPRSAGAQPGPASYGRGGNEPTVTDANLVLGRMPQDRSLAGGVQLDTQAAQTAVARLAAELDMEPRACAEGIVRVAEAEMVRALRTVTVERGIDPAEYTLLAYGGAGPLHAAAIAETLGVDRVLCPRSSGVLAALGLLVAPPRRDLQRTVLLSGPTLSAEAIAAHIEELAAALRPRFAGAEPELEATYALRYAGQSFELEVRCGERPQPAELRKSFEHQHQERYGYSDPEGVLELVTIRLTAETKTTNPRLPRLRRHGPERSRVEGPAVMELPEATAYLPPGWSAEADGEDNLWLERGR